MTDSKRARAFHWHDLPLEVRRRIARRGAGDCRPSDSRFDDIFPCHGCNCWLGNAFKNARGEYYRVLRRARQNKPINRTDSILYDGVPNAIFASGPDGTKRPESVGDFLLAALKREHAERDPDPDRGKEDAA